ncbi:MAG: hypothetical protein WDM76_16195 [Limisphaerales bacterium]
MKLGALQAANPGVNLGKIRVGQVFEPAAGLKLCMIARITFLFIATFWVAMNVLLWRAEYGARRGGMAVPPDLVWRKILTAPDASALTIYQDGQRMGFCEFSTSVEQEMAKLDEDKPPPEGLVANAGYQIRLNGNMSLGDFTNRVRFGRTPAISSARAWRELNLKVSMRLANIEIHSLAAEQDFHYKITGESFHTDGVIRFADLQNPDALLRKLAGNFGGGLLGMFDLPQMPATAGLAQNLRWEARRDHLMLGHEAVSVYRLETQLLENRIVIYASTLGEIFTH